MQIIFDLIGILILCLILNYEVTKPLEKKIDELKEEIAKLQNKDDPKE